MTRLRWTWLFYSCILLLLVNGCKGARILAFFPMPSISHQNVIKPLLDELGRRGHQVVYYSGLAGGEFHSNVKLIKIDIPFAFTSDDDDPLYTENSQIASTKNFWGLEVKFAKSLFKTQAIQDLLRSKDQFDLVFHESFIGSEYSIAFVHKFKALSVVLMGLGDTAWVNELAGLPDNPSYIIDWRGQLTDVMTFCERLTNSFNLIGSTILNYNFLYQMQDIVHEHAKYSDWETRPHLKDFIADNALILVNSHHSVGYNFPKAPHVKEIGGIHLVPKEPLPQDIAKFMDEATEGVIYFSMGSITDTKHRFVLNLRNQLLRALGTLKLRALCKLHNDSTSVPENVMILPWFPQKDILAHENLKIFISHGGLQSTFESINHGVPMITLPFFGDQYKNAKMIAKSGFGIHLDLRTITNTTLLAAVNEIINNPRYKTEAMRRSTLLKDRPISPLNEAAYWVEYVLRHGNILQPAAVHLSFIQLHQIDLFIFIAFNLIVSTFFVKKIVAFIRNKLFERVNSDKKYQ